MSCTCAPACREISRSADRRWPGRSKASDGCCASSGHTRQNPNSDHEPNADGYATAEDITHDLRVDLDTWEEADKIRRQCKAGVEKRVKYIISNRRIASAIADWEWRRYDGPNAHSHHMHLSLHRGYQLSTEPWFLESDAAPSGPPQPRQAGVVVPLPPPMVTHYPGESMKRIDVRVGLDGAGNGYNDVPEVRTKDIVGYVVNGADPQTVGGYSETGHVVEFCQRDTSARVVVHNGHPKGAVDLHFFVAES